MFSIRIWGNDRDEPDAIGIQCNNFKKENCYTIQNITVNKFITPFVVNIVFRHIVLSWIVERNDNLNFYVQELCPCWLGDGP